MLKSKDLVVSDTSPLLNLALIDRLDLLEEQFTEVTVPVQVLREIQEGSRGVKSIEKEAENGFIDVVEVEENGFFTELRSDLDKGESAAIKYAVEENADLILIDEKEGRIKARNQDLEVTGVIGILLKASSNGEVDMEEALTSLRDQGFWISDNLFNRALEKSR